MALRSPTIWLTYLAVLLIGASSIRPLAAKDGPEIAAPPLSLPTAGASATERSGFLLERDLASALRNKAVDSGRSPSAATSDRPVTLIELPGEVRLGAAPQRAHHALGFRSEAAENWLRDHGIGAKTCYLPMLRVPARVTPSGDASIAFWLYARCSFF